MSSAGGPDYIQQFSRQLPDSSESEAYVDVLSRRSHRITDDPLWDDQLLSLLTANTNSTTTASAATMAAETRFRLLPKLRGHKKDVHVDNKQTSDLILAYSPGRHLTSMTESDGDPVARPPAATGAGKKPDLLVENVLESCAEDNPLLCAAKDGHIVQLKQLSAQYGKSVYRTRNAAGSTCLHLCVQAGHLNSVQYLCRTYPALSGIENRVRYTPAALAIKCGHVAIFEWLLQNTSASTEQSLCHQAAKNGQDTCLRLLLEWLSRQGDLPDFTDTNLNTPAHAAAKYGHLACLQTLVEFGVNVTRRNRHGYSPCYYADFGSQRLCAGYLIVIETALSLVAELLNSTSVWKHRGKPWVLLGPRLVSACRELLVFRTRDRSPTASLEKDPSRSFHEASLQTTSAALLSHCWSKEDEQKLLQENTKVGVEEPVRDRTVIDDSKYVTDCTYNDGRTQIVDHIYDNEPTDTGDHCYNDGSINTADHTYNDGRTHIDDRTNIDDHTHKDDRTNIGDHTYTEDRTNIGDYTYTKDRTNIDDHTYTEDRTNIGDYTYTKDRTNIGEYTYTEDPTNIGDYTYTEDRTTIGDHTYKDDRTTIGDHTYNDDHTNIGDHTHLEGHIGCDRLDNDPTSFGTVAGDELQTISKDSVLISRIDHPVDDSAIDTHKDEQTVLSSFYKPVIERTSDDIIAHSDQPCLEAYNQTQSVQKFRNVPYIRVDTDKSTARDTAADLFNVSSHALCSAKDRPVLKHFNDPPVGNTFKDPSITETVMDPSVLKTIRDPSVAKTFKDPSVAKTIRDPSVAKAIRDPSVAKTFKEPPVTKTFNEPPVIKTFKDPPVTYCKRPVSQTYYRAQALLHTFKDPLKSSNDSLFSPSKGQHHPPKDATLKPPPHISQIRRSPAIPLLHNYEDHRLTQTFTDLLNTSSQSLLQYRDESPQPSDASLQPHLSESPHCRQLSEAPHRPQLHEAPHSSQLSETQHCRQLSEAPHRPQLHEAPHSSQLSETKHCRQLSEAPHHHPQLSEAPHHRHQLSEAHHRPQLSEAPHHPQLTETPPPCRPFSEAPILTSSPQCYFKEPGEGGAAPPTPPTCDAWLRAYSPGGGGGSSYQGDSHMSQLRARLTATTNKDNVSPTIVEHTRALLQHLAKYSRSPQPSCTSSTDSEHLEATQINAQVLRQILDLHVEPPPCPTAPDDDRLRPRRRRRTPELIRLSHAEFAESYERVPLCRPSSAASSTPTSEDESRRHAVQV